MQRPRVIIVATLFLLAAATLWAASGTMSVQVRNGQVRATPSFLGSPVAPVAYGDRVEALQQQGDWVEVTVPGGKKGWLHISALTTKQVSLGSGTKDAKVSASGEELALAGKGFNSDVEAQYRAANPGTDFTWVNLMEQMNVQPEEMVAFLKQGGVKPGTGGAK